MTPLRLATRGSPLALWQARWVAARLVHVHPGLRVVVVPLVSTGDRDRVTALYASENVGMFVREIQEAVLAGHCDAGVHSCKDLPTTLPAGLQLAAIPGRGDARDCLLGAASLAALPPGARVGTSSLRRQYQLAHLRPDLRFEPLRGNVETRLGRIAGRSLDATLLACAGLARLGLLRRARAVALAVTQLVPAPAQGAVAVDCRATDTRTRRLLAAITDRDAATAIAIERQVLAAFAGGCSLPLGCYAQRQRGRWSVVGRLSTESAAVDGSYLGPAAGAAAAIIAQLRAERSDAR